MKKNVLILAASIASFPCLQSKAWSESSLLLQMPAILAASQKGGSSVINDNVTVIDGSRSVDIVSLKTNVTGNV